MVLSKFKIADRNKKDQEWFIFLEPDRIIGIRQQGRHCELFLDRNSSVGGWTINVLGTAEGLYEQIFRDRLLSKCAKGVEDPKELLDALIVGLKGEVTEDVVTRVYRELALGEEKKKPGRGKPAEKA